MLLALEGFKKETQKTQPETIRLAKRRRGLLRALAECREDQHRTQT